MNRRDFLRSRHILRTAGQVLATLDEISQLASAPVVGSEISLLRMARQAMATTFEVVVPFGTSHAMQLGAAALDRIDELEDQLTVYRETSEVARLNRLAPYEAVRVESGLFGLLELAARINRETAGAHDITAGALIKAWGFFRGPRRVPSETELAQALLRCGMNKVELSADSQSVRYLCPGLEINLGSIGKGYALDRAGEILDQQWRSPAFLLHGGRSSVYAHGNPAGEERGWQISVSHPWDPNRQLARLWLRDQGMGTSAATFQYLEHQGRKLGHVLDPRSGWPASGVASATVVAPSSAEADALSTAFFILGVETARRYCDNHPGVGALLLPDGAEAEPITIGLSSADITLLPTRPGVGRGEVAPNTCTTVI
jgi:FAD:protein FMN transferase